MKNILSILIMLLYSSGVYCIELYAVPIKEDYLLGENIEIVITIENNSSIRRAVPLLFACPGTHLSFHFYGEPRRPKWRCRARMSDSEVVWLYPGGKYKATIDLSDYYTLEKGQYSLHATYSTTFRLACHPCVEHPSKCEPDALRRLKRTACPTCNKYPSMREVVWCGNIRSQRFTIYVR